MSHSVILCGHSDRSVALAPCFLILNGCLLLSLTIHLLIDVAVCDGLMGRFGCICVLSFQGSGHVSCGDERVCRLKVLLVLFLRIFAVLVALSSDIQCLTRL